MADDRLVERVEADIRNGSGGGGDFAPECVTVNIDDLRALLVAYKALEPFEFAAYPSMFQSPDGGCTEVIICDADVQAARAARASRN